MNIGFIGLGNMGGPMALNLIKAGHALMVHDVRDRLAAQHLAKGAHVGRERPGCRRGQRADPHVPARTRRGGARGARRRGRARRRGARRDLRGSLHGLADRDAAPARRVRGERRPRARRPGQRRRARRVKRDAPGDGRRGQGGLREGEAGARSDRQKSDTWGRSARAPSPSSCTTRSASRRARSSPRRSRSASRPASSPRRCSRPCAAARSGRAHPLARPAERGVPGRLRHAAVRAPAREEGPRARDRARRASSTCR